MQLQDHEEILYKAIPFTSLSYIIISLIGIFTIIHLFSVNLLLNENIILYALIFLPILLKFFDRIIITNQHIFFKNILGKYSINHNQIKNPPYMFIDPYLFKKYEWQRKLSGQDFQNFWKYRANIQFSQNSDQKTLNRLRLSLFSKKQTDKILTILTQAWNLDPNIKSKE